jgi:uncharacterized membrane protein
MGSEGEISRKFTTPPPHAMPPLAKTALFLVPGVIVTAVSVGLFAMLHRFTVEQFNYFTVTLLSAVILSLIGTSGLQLVIHRIVEAEPSRAAAMHRTLKLGFICAIALSVITGAAIYPYFIYSLDFPLVYFGYFVLLFFIYCLIWPIMAAFWALEQYQYPAIIFSFGYIGLFILTYSLHLLNSRYTITGYTIGLGTMMVLSIISANLAFSDEVRVEEKKMPSLAFLLRDNISAILFHVFYILALFLDKILVWVRDGLLAGGGLSFSSDYTIASLLGLMPIFSIASMVYFGAKARPLVQAFYQGKYVHIGQRVRAYKEIYRQGLAVTLASALILLALTVLVAVYLISGWQILPVMGTIGLGAIAFSTIIYNSSVLALFSKIYVSMLSVGIICLTLLAFLPLIVLDTWYAAFGFLVGSLLGSAISQIAVSSIMGQFEYRLFRYATCNALKIRREDI